MSNEYLAISKNLDIRNQGKGATIKEKLDLLALELASNYCTVSFGESDKSKARLDEIFETTNELYKTKFHKVLKGSSHLEYGSADINSILQNSKVSDINQHRNILVIGAGATYDSYSCIPLGADVVKKFNEKYGSEISNSSKLNGKLENYKEELRLQGRDLDFENVLSLYSELYLSPEVLRSEISDLFNFRYSPSPFYEIVAHLFKHSFIDVIINFNFDELLDQTIEEELGEGNYYKVVSDGDCVPITDMMIDGRLKIPIYIKPHGTISHKSTLRFTKRHYLDVPEQIRELLASLIKGERGDVIGKTEKQVNNIEQINLISVGFNLESLEFGDILNEHLPKKSRIFHFGYNEYDSKRDNFLVHKIYPKFFKKTSDYHIVEKSKPWDATDLHNHVYTRIAIERFNKESDPIDNNELTTPFTELFSYLWRRAFYLFKTDYAPRSISRHEIISYFFYNPFFCTSKVSKESERYRQELISKYENSIDYFLDRTIVEIAISINRNNGISEVSELLAGRAGIYYKKYRESYFKINKTDKGSFSFYDLILEFLGENWRKEIDTTFSTNIIQVDLNTIKAIVEQIKKTKETIDAIKSGNEKSTAKIIKEDYDLILQKWHEKTLVTNNLQEPQINDTTNALKAMLEEFTSLVLKDEEIKGSNHISIIILYRLFRVKYLSQTFISNFQNKYNKRVFNGNSFKRKNEVEIFMYQEIGRLFQKSSNKHYYSIRPKYQETRNYLSESFSKSKLLNTNLAIEYAFRYMFLKSNWDIALLVSETGSMLDFLKKVSPKEKEHLKKKKIIMINAFDAIKQFDLESKKDIGKINRSQNKKYSKLIFRQKETTRIQTFSLPSIQHNHHMMMFLTKVDPANVIDPEKVPVYIIRDKNSDEKKAYFALTDSIYMYRPGFSNYINPLVIGMLTHQNFDEQISNLRDDFKKMLRIFTSMFYKSVAFEGISELGKLGKNLNSYNPIEQEDEKDKMNRFLLFLHSEELFKINVSRKDTVSQSM